MPDGLLVKAEDRPLGSNLTAQALAGAEVLYVEWAGRFPDDGGIVDLNGVPIYYTAADEDAATLVLRDPLPLDRGVVGDQVVLLNGRELMADRDAWVLMPGDEEPITVTVPHLLLPYVPEGDDTDVYADPWPVSVDAGLSELTDVPGRPARVAGGVLIAESVTADRVSKATTGTDLVNGTFEDFIGEPKPKFAGWEDSYFKPPDDFTVARTDEATDGAELAGTRSLAIICDTEDAGLRVITDGLPYPVRGGTDHELQATLSGSRTIDRSAETFPNLVAVTMHTSDGSVDPSDLAATWQDAIVLSAITTTPNAYTGRVTVPATHTQARFSVVAEPSGDGSGWTLTADQMHKIALAPDAPAETPQLDLNADVGDGQTLLDFLNANFVGVAGAPTVWQIEATSQRNFDGDGVWNASSPSPYTGYANPTNGNRRSVLCFDDALIASHLAGKTISKVEVRPRVFSRLGPGPGTLAIGFHGDSAGSTRLTYGAVVGKNPNSVASTGWNEGTRKWVTLTDDPTEWQTGAKAGLIFGPGLSNNLIYSMGLNGPGGWSPPQLRFTYT